MTIPVNTRTFEKRSTFNTSVEKLQAFHEQPDAFSKLTPFPIIMQMHRNELKSLTEGEVEFTLWFGFIPIRWKARHMPGPIPTSFSDEQIEGPMAYWYHDHIFQEVEGGAELIDRLTIAHPDGIKGIMTRLMFDGLPLRLLFFYRHFRTRLALR